MASKLTKFYAEPNEHPAVIRVQLGQIPEAWDVRVGKWVTMPSLVGVISGAGGDPPWHEITEERADEIVAALVAET